MASIDLSSAFDLVNVTLLLKRCAIKKSRIHEHLWRDINWKALVFFMRPFSSLVLIVIKHISRSPHSIIQCCHCFHHCMPDPRVPFLRYILHFNGSCFYSLTHSIISYLFYVSVVFLPVFHAHFLWYYSYVFFTIGILD